MEWVLFSVWPWFLVGCVACILDGGLPGYNPIAGALGAAITGLAFAGGPIIAGQATSPHRCARMASSSIAVGAMAAPALSGCEMLASHSGWASLAVVLAGCCIISLSAYTFAALYRVAGIGYPVAVAAWLGLPPLLWYVCTDLMGRRIDALFPVGPVSGAAWAFMEDGQIFSRAASALLVLILAAIALSVLPVRSQSADV